MKYFIIAGEASGDLHGSNLIKALKLQDANSNFMCWGGDKMEATGATITKHIKELAFMGFIEVLVNIKTIMQNFTLCKSQIQSYKPDVLILIDYPGFNLRMAEWAKTNKLKVIYYISPQVWAWKENRVKKIKQFVDKMICILPFEKDFYKKWNFDVDYIGHPLIEAIEDFKLNLKTQNPILQNKKIIAILPGSRLQEVKTKLPLMLSVQTFFPDYLFVVAQSPTLDKEVYQPYMNPNVVLLQHQTYEILNSATAALVTSVTATVETALFGVPEVVCYKGNIFSYQIAKWLIKIKYISLVNLIANKLVVKELIQHQLNTENIKTELQKILEPANTSRLQQDYAQLKQELGNGTASKNAAEIIVGFCKKI